MADDLSLNRPTDGGDDPTRPVSGRPFPFEMPSEEAVAYSDGAVNGRPAGVPASYERGDSVRWTPESLAEVHALSRLGRYQIRGFNTFNDSMPTMDDLVFVPPP